jgi:hypothetical protein
MLIMKLGERRAARAAARAEVAEAIEDKTAGEAAE